MSYIGQRPVVGRYIKLDQISSGFNGSNTSFSMAAGSQAVSPGTARNLLLSLGGVIQEPDTDYTVLGSTLTFTTAPAAGSSFFGIVFGDMQTVSTLSDGTVVPASIASSGDFAFPADIRLKDSDGSHYVGFQAASTVSSNVVWTLPSADAAASGYALVSDGSGTLSWAAMSGGITIQEEGSSLSTAATTLNFVGSSVTATGSGATKTITITGGSAGMTAESSSPRNTHSNNAASSLTSNSENNTLIGWNSGNNISTGDNNTVLGYRAGGVANNSEETIIGANSFSERGNHIRAVGLGFGSGRWNRGTDVTAIGYEALYNGNDSSNSKENTAVGYRALYGDNSDSSGNGSTAVGYKALYARSTGDYNSALGHSALVALTTGTGNVGVGYQAGKAITTGSYGVCIGHNAGQAITTGSNYVVIGKDAAYTTTSPSMTVAIGQNSLYYGSGAIRNTLVGYNTAYNATTGDDNCCFGVDAGKFLTTGSDNILIGFEGGATNGSAGLTTGSNNIIIGTSTSSSSQTVSNEITLGNTSIDKFRIPGINVILKDNGGTPTQGHVLTVDANGEASFEAASGGGISGITIQEEGSSLSTAATTLNFIGSNVTAAGTGATKSISLTSLPSGSNTQVQFNSSGVFAGSSNLTFDGTSLSVGGTVSATSSASGTAGLRKITASTSSPSGGSDGDIWLKYDTNAATSYLPIDSNNVVKINTTGTGLGGKLQIADGSGTDADTLLSLKHIGTGDGNGIEYQHNRAGSGSTAYYVSLRNSSGTQIGTITGTSSSIAYNTSSDYRLKENASAISDGITRLKTLKPYRFNFKADTSTVVDGFFAHEVTAVPEAITGTKDAVDSDNNPIYQSIDQSKLVPLLTAALQEAVAKIEVLESKVATLEAA